MNVNMNIEKHGIESENVSVNKIPLILNKKIVHNSWATIFKNKPNNPFIVVESFSSYYGRQRKIRRITMRLLYIWKQCLSTTNISANTVGGVLHGNK